jgi:hypothetical protein
MKVKEKIEVMQAWLDGKVVQSNKYGNWLDVTPRDSNAWEVGSFTGEPGFTFDECDYRIKPKEPREFWIAVQKYHGNGHGVAYPSKFSAEKGCIHSKDHEFIKVKEELS